MSFWLLIGVSLAYLGTAVDLFFQMKYGLSIAFVAYAVANIGLMYA